DVAVLAPGGRCDASYPRRSPEPIFPARLANPGRASYDCAPCTETKPRGTSTIHAAPGVSSAAFIAARSHSADAELAGSQASLGPPSRPRRPSVATVAPICHQLGNARLVPSRGAHLRPGPACSTLPNGARASANRGGQSLMDKTLSKGVTIDALFLWRGPT
ncbi:MAG: hypothetical protein KC492_07840, partial [Myxococcales bacterium]|nr:hypothetical protein [Myxococcales bacterium]